MNCTKCNAVIPDGSAFCPECGAKVEPIQAAPVETAPETFCSNCGAPMAAGSGFCENCGAKAESAPAKPDVVGKAKSVISRIPQKFLKLGLAVVALILVIVIIAAIAGSGSSKINCAMYYKDGELYYTNLPKAKPVEITEDLDGSSTSVRLSKDGKKLFYLDKYDSGTYTLYYQDMTNTKKDPVKLDTGVTPNYTINEKANLVTYIKDGTLYQHDLKEKAKIDGDVAEFYVSGDGKQIAYLADKDEDDNYTLFRATGSKEPVKVTSDVSSFYGITEDGKTVLFRKDGGLYLQVNGKDAEKIDSDSRIVGTYYDNGSFYYMKEEEAEIKLSDLITDDKKDDSTYDYLRDYLAGEDATTTNYTNTLYFYNGKKAVAVAEYVMTYEDYALDTPVIAYTALENGEYPKVSIADYYENGYDAFEEAWKDAVEYCIAVENTTNAMTLTDVDDLYLTNDGKTAYVLSDVDEEDDTGILYRVDISGKKLKAAKKIDEDVSDSGHTVVGGSHYVYFKDVKNGKGELYLDGKKVDDDVRTRGIRYHVNTKKLIYFTDWNSDKELGTLKLYKGGKSSVVKDDVHEFTFTPDGEILFLYDYSISKGKGELYIANGSKQTKIDDDVSSFLYRAYND